MIENFESERRNAVEPVAADEQLPLLRIPLHIFTPVAEAHLYQRIRNCDGLSNFNAVVDPCRARVLEGASGQFVGSLPSLLADCVISPLKTS
jgi:hypothetical protein